MERDVANETPAGCRRPAPGAEAFRSAALDIEREVLTRYVLGGRRPRIELLHAAVAQELGRRGLAAPPARIGIVGLGRSGVGR